jgi:hypothetical protein
MTALHEYPTSLTSTHQSRWLGEPANEVTGSLAHVAPLIPTFDRYPFGTNARLDMIFRRAAAKGDIPTPIGVVSKRYVLVQHASVIAALEHALRKADIDPRDLHCRLTLSESGARMGIRVELPEWFAFNAPDRHPMALTFECFNSVDRTVPLFALLGWFRFVCSNGLVVGTTHASLRQRHRPPLQIDELQPLLSEGLTAAICDRERLTASMTSPVSVDALRTWVDGPVANAWGAFAAARVHEIATTGRDGEPSRTQRGVPPHAREIINSKIVPGAEAPCKTRYGPAGACVGRRSTERVCRARCLARRNPETPRAAGLAALTHAISVLRTVE